MVLDSGPGKRKWEMGRSECVVFLEKRWRLGSASRPSKEKQFIGSIITKGRIKGCMLVERP